MTLYQSKLTGLILILLPLFLCAQKEANIWYFGSEAGLDFNSGSPVALTDGVMNTAEGCASISDENGNLLFYTDGITIWNANHDATPNGADLLGDFSSTQSAIIVQKPESDSLYYVFTVPAVGNSAGLRYSEFDITLDGGLGDVTANKNILMSTPVCEKVTAVRHANGRDIWILSHGFGNNEWLAFLVDENGPSLAPVTTNIGVSILGINTAIGYMKASPDGSRAACVHWASPHPLELVDFDNSTGVFSNLINIDLPSVGAGPYGLEFSPNSDVIYVTMNGTNQYSQFDLTAGDIQASEEVFFIPGLLSMGALQLGPDGKIYIVQVVESSLSVINEPNELGVASDLQFDAVSLNGKMGVLGLPTFFPDIFLNSNFSFTQACLGDTTFFELSSNLVPDSVFWNFDDPGSGVDSISTEIDPYHIFTGSDTFEVMLIVFRDSLSDTSFQEVVINPLLEVHLGDDTTLCAGQELQLGGSLPMGSYEWQDGSTNQMFIVVSEGEYSVTVTDGICFYEDTIDVFYYVPPLPDLGIDTSFCEGDSLLLDPGDYSEYEWQDGSDDAIFEVDISGNYSVVVTDSNGCVGTDMIVVGVNPLPIIDLGADTTICSGETLVLDAQIPGGTYLWQDSSVGSTLEVDESGTYSVEVVDANGCQNEDEMELFLSEVIGTFEGSDLLCFGDNTGSIDGDFIDEDNLDFNWSSGQTSVDLENLSSGVYEVLVTNGDGCQYDTTIVLSEPSLLNFVSESVDVECFGESNGMIIVEGVQGGTSPYEYRLDSGAYQSNALFDGLIAGTYSLAVRDSNGCESELDLEITEPANIILDVGQDTVIRLGSSLTFDVLLISDADLILEWLTSQILSCDNCLNPTVSPTESGDYVLTVIDPISGCEKRDTIFVQVDPRDQVYVPNAFSPNGDGTNDHFYPHGSEGVLRVDRMSVYNRWGELMHAAENFAPGDPQYGWDGRFKGQDSPNGVYVYYIQVRMIDGSTFQYIGDVNVIR